MQHPPRIAVIGAGPAGLTAALILHRGGHRVSVYEGEASGQQRTQGGTLDLHDDSGQVALQRAGLLEAFRAVARHEGAGGADGRPVVRGDHHRRVRSGREQGQAGDRPRRPAPAAAGRAAGGHGAVGPQPDRAGICTGERPRPAIRQRRAARGGHRDRCRWCVVESARGLEYVPAAAHRHYLLRRLDCTACCGHRRDGRAGQPVLLWRRGGPVRATQQPRSTLRVCSAEALFRVA
ncbi:FAD-dependent monooxygenase [Stenotrophomonas maltophilia]|nr:FAD-dependent monooxygenase [Stenotrophomonas maltophilia]